MQGVEKQGEGLCAMALVCKDGFQLHFTYDLGFG